MRQTEGYLPKANVAFVDEIFKANSAILNTLLTVLNERLFDNGTTRELVPLLCLVRFCTQGCTDCHCTACPSQSFDAIAWACLGIFGLCIVTSNGWPNALPCHSPCWCSVRYRPSLKRSLSSASLLLQVGASNELPESEELDALYDRFLIRRQVSQVSDFGLPAMLAAAADNVLAVMSCNFEPFHPTEKLQLSH